MSVDFTLSFNKNRWVCYNDQVKIVADSLDDIDIQIEFFLKKQYPSGSFNIDMHFDFDRFPIWMRQYMPHYFNRNYTVTIEQQSK